MYRHQLNSLRLAIQPFTFTFTFTFPLLGGNRLSYRNVPINSLQEQNGQIPDLANSIRDYTTATVCGGTLHFGDR